MSAMPHWDLTPFFPSLDSPQFKAAFDGIIAEVDSLTAIFEKHEVRRRSVSTVGTAEAEAFQTVTTSLNEMYDRHRLVRSYLHFHVTTDAANEEAQGLQSELRMANVAYSNLGTRYYAWVGTMDADTLLSLSATARDHEYVVREAAYLAAHQMPQPEEELAAALSTSAIEAWARLHQDVTALKTVTVPLPDGEQTLPMSAVRGLANDADRGVREAAHHAEIAGWKTVEVPLAAALNGVKGYQRVLRERRGFADDVEPTLRDNRIDAETLAAMQQACVESFPDFRRYMRAKARALGLERLAWWDVAAPVGSASRRYSWEDSEAFLRQQFGTYSEKLASFADRSFRERWTDAEPRPGKEGGAYCAEIVRGISRVLMNHDGSFNSVSTLAHELGHAYHNLCLEKCTSLQDQTPSTLAETASIFCETIAFEAALKDAEGDERIGLLEVSLQRDLQVVVDIHSRFLFENAVFEQRGRRELSAAEFSELMLDAQRQTYGDGLDPDALHPYMWAVKGHYYGPTFYNYPYTFGLLFGLGLYARYRQQPEGFHDAYDALLASTGLADAATLGERFGINTRSVEFWRSSLDVIRANIAEFERLTSARG